MKIPMKNIAPGIAMCLAAWLFAVFYPDIHKNAFAVLIVWWIMGATAINYSLWKMEYSSYQRYQVAALRLGLFGFSVVCLGGLLGQASDMETVSNFVLIAGLVFAVLGIVAVCFGLIKKDNNGIRRTEADDGVIDPDRESAGPLISNTGRAMKRAIKLTVIGFTLGLAGLLIAIFFRDYGIAGAVLFSIGWLIAATGILIGIWKNEYPVSQRWLGIGMKIAVIGILIFFLGALLEVPDDMETLSNILVKVGQYIIYAGIFVGFLGIIEDNMHK